jgi:raffinose/stachyose/melibiose transport system permease protein
MTAGSTVRAASPADPITLTPAVPARKTARRRRQPGRPAVSQRLVVGLIVLAGCIVFATPLLLVLFTSIQPETQVITNGPASLPHHFTMGNFSAAWTGGALGRYYRNSLLILVVKVPVGIVLSSLAAYPLSKMRFRGRKTILVCLLVGLGVPQVVTLYPLLELSKDVGLSGSVWILLLPYLAFGMPFEIFVMRGAFASVPEEVLEAARIDGAGEFRIWARVCMPMVLAPLASLAILDGVATWNEFVIALALLSNQSSDTLPIGISNLQGQFGVNFAQLSAGVLIAVAPMVLLFFVARRYLVRGVAAGALKG